MPVKNEEREYLFLLLQGVKKCSLVFDTEVAPKPAQANFFHTCSLGREYRGDRNCLKFLIVDSGPLTINLGFQFSLGGIFSNRTGGM
jgi:hypothetical protein